ncbi:LAME_0A04478g1_1 [Lachancea meyersii CBS 8951]|uniref:Aldehyde dehydrogenase n=1 Tax=Lachancea meyersii CBS 8951 TaxID=1266667 RepID=A0A1G4INZ5_9SACH|nr:LAME_0A04478g1_1 [Lachancea meyersii CBS 8951]
MSTSSLNYTPVDDIDDIVLSTKKAYQKRQWHLAETNNPKKEDLKLRLEQLQKLYYGLKDHEDEIVDALKKDFNRSRLETFVIELIPLYNHLLHLIENLPRHIEPEKISESGDLFKLSSVKVERISLGCVLVISPFNYPVLLALDPVAAAIGCGNSVILKPSEQTPAAAQVMEKILRAALSPSWVRVVHGAVNETSALIKNPNFDKIFYTGSTKVGRIVAQEAAKNLVPVTLELGGKSPVFITEHLAPAKLKAALSRVFFGAFSNSGQTCVAADYLLVHESHLAQVRKLTTEVLDEFWPTVDPSTINTSMIHEAAYKGAMEKLNATGGQKVRPTNVSDNLPNRCIAPTVVFDVGWDDSLMEAENFSPVLPVISYRDLNDVVAKVMQQHRNPLALYIFSQEQQEIDRIMTMIKSGGCVINDTMVHVIALDAPFGGIRESGQGNYHGFWSFSAFTHERTVVKQPFWIEFINGVRYPPFSARKLTLARAAMEKKPGFRRDGSKPWPLGKLVLMSFLVIFVARALHFMC